MDPQSASFTPRDDNIWRMQNDMIRVQQNQAELAERLSRVERRQDEDARAKSVWGTSSPFPSVLSGTPQQGWSLSS
jgi:ubiquitin carboxyl-terminal hydrolase 4/11/15